MQTEVQIEALVCVCEGGGERERRPETRSDAAWVEAARSDGTVGGGGDVWVGGHGRCVGRARQI